MKLALLAALCASCAPPPYGEALVVVDTDLPAPAIAGRLRVDVFREDGTWIESRDVARPRASDWPVSFSLYSDDFSTEKRVLVRLRAYPEGRLRDYHGERFAPRPPWTPPAVAADLGSLCANPPELPLGQTIALRRGHAPVTALTFGSDCARFPSEAVTAGSVAARVHTAAAGRYRFAVVTAEPANAQVTLEVRGACADESSAMACSTGIAPDGLTLPDLTVALDGDRDYFLLTSGVGAGAGPADLLLGAAVPGQEWTVPSPTAMPPVEGGPRLARADGSDGTPAEEPIPSATVDRLVLVRLTPGVRGSVRVTLAGACAGTMARLSSTPPYQAVDLAGAATCVDEEAKLAPLVEAPRDPSLERPTSSAAGRFGASAPCDGAPADPEIACVPGGALLFGSAELSGLDDLDAVPERVAVIPRLWVDRHEVTVARWRAAPIPSSGADPTPIAHGAKRSDGSPLGLGECSWSDAPDGREDFALSCISWYQARAFCRARGGDLPTEAEWEWIASAAGRAEKTRYPWGDDEPDCGHAAIARMVPGASSGDDGEHACDGVTSSPEEPAFGPLAVGARPLDATPAGVLDLGGGLREWVRDAEEAWSGGCWRSQPLADPWCDAPEAPVRSARGGGWAFGLIDARSQVRANAVLIGADPGVGFRCVYFAPPGAK